MSDEDVAVFSSEATSDSLDSSMHGAVWLTARVEQMILNWRPSVVDKFTQL